MCFFDSKLIIIVVIIITSIFLFFIIYKTLHNNCIQSEVQYRTLKELLEFLEAEIPLFSPASQRHKPMPSALFHPCLLAQITVSFFSFLLMYQFYDVYSEKECVTSCQQRHSVFPRCQDFNSLFVCGKYYYVLQCIGI